MVAALEHAMRYDAYDAGAVERILEARFKPRSLEGQMAESTRAQIRNAMREHPVRQRPLTEYAALRTGDGTLQERGQHYPMTAIELLRRLQLSLACAPPIAQRRCV